MTQYVFCWNIGCSEPVVVNLSMSMIAWMVGVRKARRVRIWRFTNGCYPEELNLVINYTTHEVALQDPVSGVLVDRCEYAHVG